MRLATQVGDNRQDPLESQEADDAKESHESVANGLRVVVWVSRLVCLVYVSRESLSFRDKETQSYAFFPKLKSLHP